MVSEELDKALKEVGVIGAAGKMGRGISLLLLQEMAKQEAQHTGSVGKGAGKLNLIDNGEHLFVGLKSYLKSHIIKYAEKNINMLREAYARDPKLVSNEEIIQAFVEGAMDLLRFDTNLDRVKDCRMIFEAIVEDIDAKARLFGKLDALCHPETYYFTNTSTIPIGILQDKAELGNRIIGYHFYNPPHIQKLVEVIYPDNVDPSIKELSLELGQTLKKIIVTSKDVAGFIGNGHFIREIHYTCEMVTKLAKQMPLTEAIYVMNRVTKDYLIRPMGMFQLIDYVGLDVVQRIAKIMQTYLSPEKFENNLVDNMLNAGISGGQYPDGSQKDGFFKYEKNVPVGIHSIEEKKYHLFAEGNWPKECDRNLGELPEGYFPWKKLVNDPTRNEKLTAYFQNLFKDSSKGSELAREFLDNSRNIARKLVKDGVCQNMDDLNKVLENGFFHLYGADSIFLKESSYETT